MSFNDTYGVNGLEYIQPNVRYPDNKPQDFNTKRDQLYNTGKSLNTGIRNSDELLLYGRQFFPTGFLWDMESKTEYCRFNYTGIGGQIFNTSDFSFKNLNYCFSYRKRINLSTPIGGDYYIEQSDYIVPKYSEGWSVADDNIENISSSGDIQPSKDGDYLVVGKGKQSDGDIPNLPDDLSRIANYYEAHSLPLINFNKEGFLKYYTEEAN